jgi:hypothetical protein
MTTIPRIYATLAWGFSPERWGAIGFSIESVRNELADCLRRTGGLVLTMGTMGPETAEEDRGRLLGLHELGTRALLTETLVEPSLWAEHLVDNGRPKWPYGLPIISAERFADAPRRADLLPRLHDENLHRKLASNYEILTEDEAVRVMGCVREPVTQIWTSESASFVSRILSRPPKGPPPTPGQRVLSATSGPAATYCFRLEGQAVAQVTRNLVPWPSDLAIYKVGFSNDPNRRLSELNAYLPDAQTLRWTSAWAQWHTDEINAWAMEQEVFRILTAQGSRHVKGEIFAVSEGRLRDAFTRAQSTATRPAGCVAVLVGSEERIRGCVMDNV